MNKINFFLSRLALIFMLFFWLGCSKPDNKNSVDIDYLLPHIRDKVIHMVELRSAEGDTKLIREGGTWWVDKPVDFRAEQNVIESYLRNLTDAEIGKRIKVSSADLHKLGLDEESGISTHLHFGENEKVTVIIGELDFPDDTSTTGLLGPGYSARRYMRVIGEQDEVFLVDISLIDLSAAPALWTDHTIIRIPSFKRVLITTNDNITYEFFRNHMFGTLYRRGVNGVVQEEHSNLLECFERFLKAGRCDEVGNVNVELQSLKKMALSSLIVEDFLGTSYLFNWALPEMPSEEEINRAELSTGFLSHGLAAERVPFTIEVSVTDVELNPYEQMLKKENLEVAEGISRRVIYADFKHVYCLYDLVEGSK